MAQPEPQDLLAGLNPAQAAAVQHTDGPTMIIAGAGSGKTRVLTHRLAYIIQQGRADAFQLLALTFTNKASREMRERISRLVGNEARNIPMGTFHSVFSRILRIEADKLGYTHTFTIFDDDDAMSLVRSLLKEQRLDDKKYKPRNILNRISSAKNHLITPLQFLNSYAPDEYSEVTAKLYGLYQTRIFGSNAMDFDDLLMNMVVLFDRHPEVLYKYQHRYKYVMVDEYQDTNHAQYLITKKLAAVHENICVVGDDAQSIYSFRGANIQNILNFQKDYPDLQVFKLEQNYRSTGIIVAAANEIIAQNKNQIPKLVYTENEEGELIHTFVANTDQEEAQRVVDVIREHKMVRGLYNKNIAILYRTNAQSRAFEDGLRRAGIVYKIFGGLSFYKRKEVKDVVAYMRLAINARDEEAIKRVINYPARGIGDVTIDKLLATAGQQNLTLWQTMEQAQQLQLGRVATVIEPFVTMVQSFQTVAARETAFEAVSHIAKQSGILKDLHKDNSTEGLSRWENVQELINAAREYTDRSDVEDKSLAGFLSEIALFTDADQKIPNDDYVTLMTIHSAKGLEFKSVFVVGMEEGLFPGMMSMQSREDLEEERRLFYVAVTRAEQHLTLTYARSRFRYGQLQYCEPSRFLSEIDSRYMRYPSQPRIKQFTDPKTYLTNDAATIQKGLEQRRAQQQTQVSVAKQLQQHVAKQEGQVSKDFVADEDLSALDVGVRVEHNKFGIGQVMSIDGRGNDTRLHIQFTTGSPKTILLKYARLRIVK